MGLTQNVPSTNICFYKYADNSGLRVSPDMILTAFDVKFHAKKNVLPPRACRPSKKLKKTMSTKWTTNKLKKKNNVEKVGPKKLKKNNVEKVV